MEATLQILLGSIHRRFDSGQGGGDDLASNVSSAGRRLSGDRQGILERVMSNPVLSRHRSFFESLSDEELSKMAEDAARMVIAEMGVSR